MQTRNIQVRSLRFCALRLRARSSRPPTTTTVGAGTLLATTSVTYDDNGNVATSTDAKGTVTSYAIPPRTCREDHDPRLRRRPVAGTTPRDVVVEARAYDPAGRLASRDGRLGRTTSYTYWLDDLPRQEILDGYRPPDLSNGVLSSPAHVTSCSPKRLRRRRERDRPATLAAGYGSPAESSTRPGG